MKSLGTIKTIAAAALVAGAGLFGTVGIANAASVTFDMFTSTNPISLSPTVTVTENGNDFDVSIDLDTLDIGSLIAVFIDFVPTPTAAEIATLGISAISPSPSPDSVVYGNTVNTIDAANGGVCGNFADITGLAGLPLFELAACYDKKDTAGVDPITFKILDVGNVLALLDFNAFGLRYQESNNPGGSDKLLGFQNMSPVPLPAAGFLLIGALGGLGFVARRKRKAA